MGEVESVTDDLDDGLIQAKKGSGDEGDDGGHTHDGEDSSRTANGDRP